MATPIKIKRSAVSGKRPQLTDLQVGELALNTYDGFLFTERVGSATTVSNLTPWTESYGASSISYLNLVGIGTNNPTEQLHLAADSAHQILLKRGGASPSEVTFGNEGNTARISNNTNGIDLRTGLTPSSSMRIDRNGKVGIGTENPADPLHIFSDGDGQLRLESADNGAVYQQFYRYNSGISTRISYFGFGGTGNDMSLANEIPGGDILLKTTPSGASAGAEENALQVKEDKSVLVFGDLNVSGVSTFVGNTQFDGNVSIGGTLTYEDVTNIDAVGLITAQSGIRVTGGVIEAQAGQNKIPSLYADLAALPSANTYHGMFAHVHATGRGYFAHAGNWLELVNKDTSGNVTLSGDLDVTGISTISNLEVNSGIVTAASGIATYNGDLVIGTPTGGFKTGAFTINTTDKTKDSINDLNNILGKLVPSPPDTINGVSISLTGTAGNGRLCAGFTPTNNTGGSAPSAGTQYTRNTDSTVSTTYITEYGPGDSGTVTGFVNAVGVGTTTLSSGDNDGTYGAIQIANNEDASNSTRNTGIASEFYEIYDLRMINAASPDGYNLAKFTQGSSTTGSVYWYEDPSTVSAPVISFSSVTYPASPTLSYSSGIPHYTQASANAFTYALGVENASGDMYTQNTFVSSDGQTSGFQNPGNKNYTNFTGGTNPPARNYGVGAAVTTQISQQPRDLHLTATSNVFTSFDASTPYGSHNNQRVGFTTDVNIMGTTARTNKIDEDNILITSLGTGSGNATRVNAGSTGDNPSPVFTSWGGGSAGSIATYEAAVRGAVLRHDQTDYSTGYLPVGPDYSSGRSGTQYFQIELIRSNVSEFSISYTGSVAGCFVCMPQNSAWTTSLSGVNGWANMFQAYKGSGIPTSAEPGCSSGGLMDNNGGTFTCVFGTESSSNDTGNRILIRWKLTSGQSITSMSFTST